MARFQFGVQILGEATRKLSAEAKSSEPKIPWKEIAGFRNRAAHEYFNIRLSIVWDTVEDDIPVLLDALHRMKQRDLGYEAHGQPPGTDDGGADRWPGGHGQPAPARHRRSMGPPHAGPVADPVPHR